MGDIKRAFDWASKLRMLGDMAEVFLCKRGSHEYVELLSYNVKGKELRIPGFIDIISNGSGVKENTNVNLEKIIIEKGVQSVEHNAICPNITELELPSLDRMIFNVQIIPAIRTITLTDYTIATAGGAFYCDMKEIRNSNYITLLGEDTLSEVQLNVLDLSNAIVKERAITRCKIDTLVLGTGTEFTMNSFSDTEVEHLIMYGKDQGRMYFGTVATGRPFEQCAGNLSL